MASWCELKDVSFISLSGPDSTKFLHNICSNDIKSMNVGDGKLAGFLSRTGKPVCLADIKKTGDSEYLLISNGIERGFLTAFLSKYIIMEKVTLEDVSDRYRYYLLNAFKEISLLGIELKDDLLAFTLTKELMVFRTPYGSKSDVGIVASKDISAQLSNFTQLDHDDL